MRILIITLFAFLTITINAQEKMPSRAELDSLMKDLKKKIAEGSDDPDYRNIMKDAGVNLPEDFEADNELEWKLPAPDTRAIARLPKTALTPEALPSYILDIRTRINSVLTPVHKSRIKKIKDSLKNNPILLSRVAVLSWYGNSPYIALGLATEAALLNQQNAEVLNTFATLLSLNRLPFKSIPVLEYLDKKLPGNATVLNNIGQAYLAMGSLKKAEEYLLKSAAGLETHPEATKSLGMIYRAQGQTAKAKHYIQKSLEGGFSETAAEAAEDLGISSEEVDKAVLNTLHDFKAPEYFNNYKYHLPQMPESVTQSVKAKKEIATFRAQMQVEMTRLRRLQSEEQAKAEKNISFLMTNARNGKFYQLELSPMFEKAKRMMGYYAMEFQKYGVEVLHLEYLKVTQRSDVIRQAYDAEVTRLAQRNTPVTCAEYDALSNKYLPLYAQNYRDYVEKYLPEVRSYMNQMMYWSQYMNIIEEGRMRVFGYMLGYFHELDNLARDIVVITPACSELVQTNPEVKDSAQLPKGDCPFNVSINIIVGKLAMDCDKLSIGMDAGFSFSAEKNFLSGETTLALGIGLSADFSLPVPGISLTAGAGASEQLYIVFDRNNSYKDVGLQWKASAGGSFGVSGAAGSTTITEHGVEGGYKWSLNDGIKFSGEGKGIFKDAFN